MNAPLLTEEFHLLAAAPNGVKKLRELILTLAMSGKLVPQDVKEQSKKTTLGRIGTWAVGSGFPLVEQGLTGLEILFAKVSDMNLPENSKYIVKTNHCITRETAKRLKVNIHPAGSVVFPKIGGAIATNKRRILTRDTAIDNNCLGLIPKAGVSTDWLYVLLCSIDFTKYQAGTSVPALAQGVLEDIPVQLPSLAEQHRIVAKVDELMALCDQLDAQQTTQTEAHERIVVTLLDTLTQSADAAAFADNWSRIAEHFDLLFDTPESIDKLKQSVLQLALQGKLVPQDSKDASANDLLGKIKSEKTKLLESGRLKKQISLSPVTEDEKRFALPNGWEWSRLLDCSLLVTDGEHATPQRTSDRTKVPMVTAKNVRDGYMDYLDTDFVEQAVAEKCWQRCKPSKGDILMVSVGATLGRLSIVKESRDMVIVRSVTLIRPLLMDVNYLALALQSPMIQKAVWGAIRQMAQPGLYLAQSSNLLIPIPPLAEQHRIVVKVDELMAVCDALAARLGAARDLSNKLASTIAEAALS